LPNKHFSHSVWKWIGREAKIYNSNASQISSRIENDFKLSISENTIRNIIDEIDIYLEHKIDENTQRIVKNQGKVLISFDGQRPEDGKDALWLFVDLISNRVLDVHILSVADHNTLHECIEGILDKYGVELVGLVSDKQGSIVKMHSEFYPHIPHQYCQFHFLQNIWNFLEVKDSFMQKELRKVINHLPVITKDKHRTVNVPNVGKVNYREHFSEIESDLRKLVKSRGKKFEKLRGITSYTRIQDYLENIDDICEIQDKNHRVTKILNKTSEKLHDILDQQKTTFDGCIDLNNTFQTIRNVLNAKDLLKKEHQDRLDAAFKSLWNRIKKKAKNMNEIKSFLPKSNASFLEIKEQWVRLHKSYEKGLFQYYDFPVKERTNSKMEQHFGREKMKFISRSGKANVSRQIRVRGIYELKIAYICTDEVKLFLNSIDGEYSNEEVKKGLHLLQERQKKESNKWQTAIHGQTALYKLYGQKNGEKKT
jgi:hypothetical protein